MLQSSSIDKLQGTGGDKINMDGSRAHDNSESKSRQATGKLDILEESRRVWDRFGWPYTDEMIAASAIIRAHQVIISRMDTILRLRGLSHARLELLTVLYASRQGKLPLGKVSERLLVHPTSVTGLVDRLEKDGMVARERSESDRRTVLACITRLGREVVEELAPKLGAMKHGFEGIDEAAVIKIIDAMQPIRRSAGDIA